MLLLSLCRHVLESPCVCASIVWQFSDKLIIMDLEGILSDPLSGALSDPLTSLEGECFKK